MAVVQELSWKVEGEFITRISREMLWNDHKPYQDVEKFLSDILICDEISDTELKQVIKEILEGKKKLVGINTFSLEDDDSYPKRSLDLSDVLSSKNESDKKVRELERELSELKAQMTFLELDRDKNYMHVSEVNDKFVKPLQEEAERFRRKNDPIYRMRVVLSHCNFIDNITFHNIFDNVTDDVKDRFNDFCDEFNIYPGRNVHGNFIWIKFYDRDTDEALSLDDCKSRGISIFDEDVERERELAKEANSKVDTEEEETLGWGWLYPSGKYKEADFGDHEEAAQEIIEDSGWKDEFRAWDKTDLRLARDFLVEVKGFVLLHNPSGFGVTQVSSKGIYTKRQREFLYDYFIKEGYPEIANSFYDTDY
jgi:hypothetical protein